MTIDPTPDEPTAVDPDGVAAATVLLDVRREPAYRSSTSVVPGAAWRDPARVAEWCGEWPAGTAVVAYCVHGHEVSQSVAAQLRATGLDARYLRGGIEGWAAAGRPLQRRDATP